MFTITEIIFRRRIQTPVKFPIIIRFLDASQIQSIFVSMPTVRAHHIGFGHPVKFVIEPRITNGAFGE